VVDEQVEAVQLARLGVVDDVVVDLLRQLQRVQVVVRVRRILHERISVRDRHDADRRACQLVEVVVVPAQRRLGVVGDVPGQDRAHRGLVLRIQVLVGGVLDPAVALVVDAGHAQREAVDDRRVDHAGEDPGVVFADAHLGVGLELVGRLLGVDRHRAGRAVAAEQRALRTLQHFDALDVVERGQRRAGAGGVDAVDVHADRRVGADAEVAGRDAAQFVARLGRAAAGDHEARDEAVQLRHVGRAGVADQVLAHDLDADRHVLQRLVTALGPDDHFLEHALRRDHFLRQSDLRNRESARTTGQHRRHGLRDRRTTSNHLEYPVARLGLGLVVRIVY